MPAPITCPEGSFPWRTSPEPSAAKSPSWRFETSSMGAPLPMWTLWPTRGRWTSFGTSRSCEPDPHPRSCSQAQLFHCDLDPIGIEKVGVHSRHAARISAVFSMFSPRHTTTAAETLRRAGSLSPEEHTPMRYLLMLAAAASLAACHNRSEDETGAAPDRGDTTAVTATDTTFVQQDSTAAPTSVDTTATPTGDTTGYTPTDTSTSATPTDTSSTSAT